MLGVNTPLTAVSTSKPKLEILSVALAVGLGAVAPANLEISHLIPLLVQP